MKNTTATLIDKSFTNDLQKVETASSMFVFDISDHYQIVHITKTIVENCDPNIIKKRQFNGLNILRVSRSLSTHDCSNLINDP